VFRVKRLHRDARRRNLCRDSPLSTDGRQAEDFAALTLRVWKGTAASVGSTTVMGAVDDFVPQFDAHELLVLLLDGIHEALNRRAVKETGESVAGDGMNDEAVAVRGRVGHRPPHSPASAGSV